MTTTAHTTALGAAWDLLEARCLASYIAAGTSQGWEGDTVRQATWDALVDAAKTVGDMIGWDWYTAYLRVYLGPDVDSTDAMGAIIEESTEIAVHPDTLLPVAARRLAPDVLAAARTSARWCRPKDLAPGSRRRPAA